MPDGLQVDLGDLGTQLKDIDRKMAAAVRKQVRAAVAAEGASVLQAVRSGASWSSRIPAATKLTTSFSARKAGVTLRTSAAKAPHARALESGSHNQYAPQHVSKLIAEGGKTALGTNRLSRRGAMKQLRSAGLNSRVNVHRMYNRAWFATQSTRPYFFPAVTAMTPGIEASMQGAIDRAVREAGFN